MRIPVLRFMLAIALVSVVPLASPLAAQADSSAATRSTNDRIYTAQQAAQGRDIYDGRCKSCHTAISHTGTPFRTNWDKRLLADLFDYINEKMPEDAPGTLSGGEYTLVLAYILSMNGMPAGQEELPADKKALKAIRIDAAAPKDTIAVSSHRVRRLPLPFIATQRNSFPLRRSFPPA
ncbi:MAG: cytochrome c [Gemmatimonadaceae bacterium]